MRLSLLLRCCATPAEPRVHAMAAYTKTMVLHCHAAPAEPRARHGSLHLVTSAAQSRSTSRTVRTPWQPTPHAGVYAGAAACPAPAPAGPSLHLAAAACSACAAPAPSRCRRAGTPQAGARALQDRQHRSPEKEQRRHVSTNIKGSAMTDASSVARRCRHTYKCAACTCTTKGRTQYSSQHHRY